MHASEPNVKPLALHALFQHATVFFFIYYDEFLQLM